MKRFISLILSLLSIIISYNVYGYELEGDDFRFFYENDDMVTYADEIDKYECENGNIYVDQEWISWSRGGAVHYGINCQYNWYNADKSVTKVNIDNVGITVSHNVWHSTDRYLIHNIKPEAFKDCKNLTEFNIAGDDRYLDLYYPIINVGNNAFENCTSLEGIRFPNGKSYKIYAVDEYPALIWHETTIGEYAFKNCTNLKYVIIDGLDTVIEENAFYGCPNVVIYCNSKSLAERYAKANNIKYVLMDNEYSDLEKAIFNYDMYSKNVPGLVEVTAADFYKSDDNKDDLCTTYDLLLAGWVQRGVEEEIQGSRVFDVEYYKAANPDVVKVWGNSNTAMYNHFIKYGVEELRKKLS